MKVKFYLAGVLVFIFCTGCGGPREYKDKDFGFSINTPENWQRTVKNENTFEKTLVFYKFKNNPEANPSITVEIQPQMGYDSLDYLNIKYLSKRKMESQALDEFPMEYIEEPSIVEYHDQKWAQAKIKLKNAQEEIYVLVTKSQSYILVLHLTGKMDEKADYRLFHRVWMSFKLL